ncbi:MAG: ABC transporter permease, partial [Candidatus Thorarchaeota archaeon]|nr:ABC transporter permease [Candidatus Thorarchaeota archaeon]
MAEVFTKPSRRIRNMIAKELRLIVKDRVALFLIFLLPAVSIGILYYVTQESGLSGMGGGIGDTENVDELTEGTILGLIDHDTTRTYEREDLSENFTGYMEELVEQLILYTNEADAYQDMYDKKIMGYVVIPDGFERNLTLNEPTYVTVHVDATDFIEQSTVMGVVQGASIMFRATHLWIESEVFPAMMIEFMPVGGYVEIVFGGFIVIFSSYLGIAMTSAQSIVGDIPLRRMLLTPT